MNMHGLIHRRKSKYLREGRDFVYPHVSNNQPIAEDSSFEKLMEWVK